MQLLVHNLISTVRIGKHDENGEEEEERRTRVSRWLAHLDVLVVEHLGC